MRDSLVYFNSVHHGKASFITLKSIVLNARYNRVLARQLCTPLRTNALQMKASFQIESKGISETNEGTSLILPVKKQCQASWRTLLRPHFELKSSTTLSATTPHPFRIT